MKTPRMQPIHVSVTLLTLVLLASAPLQAQQAASMALDEVTHRVPAEVYPVDFPHGDGNYQSILPASDGQVYFTVCAYHADHAARLYRFDPQSRELEQLADMSEALGEPVSEYIPQGKVHTPLYEYKGKIYAATHTAYYAHGLPNPDGEGRKPYAGGHFFCYDPATGEIEDLGNVMEHEGIISLQMDTERGILYGLTWPSGLVVTCRVEDRQMRYWGAVQGRAGWGATGGDAAPGGPGTERQTICRSLVIDDAANVYGSTGQGQVWRMDIDEPRAITYLDLSLTSLTPEDEPLPRGGSHMWRSAVWNPTTGTIWGMMHGSGRLFELDPEAATLRSVTFLTPDNQPSSAHLGLAVADSGVIYYLGRGPAVAIADRAAMRKGVNLFSYNPKTQRMTNHGPVIGEGDRRVYHSESLAIAPDGSFYTVAWLEVTDPERRAALQQARGRAAPEDQKRFIWEIALLRMKMAP